MEDGRFQELSLPPLQMKVETEEELDAWVSLLAEKLGPQGWFAIDGSVGHDIFRVGSAMYCSAGVPNQKTER